MIFYLAISFFTFTCHIAPIKIQTGAIFIHVGPGAIDVRGIAINARGIAINPIPIAIQLKASATNSALKNPGDGHRNSEIGLSHLIMQVKHAIYTLYPKMEGLQTQIVPLSQQMKGASSLIELAYHLI